jgi:hypothetical protein
VLVGGIKQWEEQARGLHYAGEAVAHRFAMERGAHDAHGAASGARVAQDEQEHGADIVVALGDDALCWHRSVEGAAIA